MECPTNPSGLRHGLTLIIAIMVMSSPIVILVDPTLAVAAKSNLMDTSNNHATVSTSSSPDTVTESSPATTIGTPTIQAALSSLTARPTNNIVNTNSFYDVVFLTATAGAIKTIQVTFPAGTTIPSGAFFNEAEKCAPGSDCTEMTGTASKSGQTITYTVTNAVNVPAGTKIRLEFANINNPLSPSANYQVTVTTRNAANAIIDGPTQSTAYTIKQIGVNAIADGSITSTKPAESFMKRVTLEDDFAGNSKGWDPNGAFTTFSITDTESVDPNTSFTSVFVEANTNHFCDTTEQLIDGFNVRCSSAPIDGEELQYLLVTLPSHEGG